MGNMRSADNVKKRTWMSLRQLKLFINVLVYIILYYIESNRPGPSNDI